MSDSKPEEEKKLTPAQQINEKFQEIGQKAISDRVFPGCFVWIKAKDIESSWSFGNISFEDTMRPSASTYWDIGSIGKYHVALAIWRLIYKNQLDLSARVTKFIPLAHESAQSLTIYDLLAYRVRFEIRYELQKYDIWEGTPDEWLEAFCREAKVEWKEGSYSNISPLLLGLVLEDIFKKPGELGEILQELVFEPNAMYNTTFDLVHKMKRPEDRKRFIAPTEPHIPLGTPHDGLARLFKGRAIGASGLSSTIDDMAILAHIFAGAGLDKKDPFISKEIYQSMVDQRHMKLADSYAPGFQIFIRNAMLMTSFTGCMVLGAQDSEIGPFEFVLLAHPVASPTSKTEIDGHHPIFEVRRSFINAPLRILSQN